MSASRTGPVSVLYGGAHLFGENVGDKLGRIARKSVETYLGDDESLARVFQLEDHSLARDVRAALRRRMAKAAVDDYRIDFEDGYGVRSAAEEDRDAERTGLALARTVGAGKLPPYIGLRVRRFGGTTRERALRTARLFFSSYVSEGEQALPPSFVVTLPKVETPDEVADACAELARVEQELGWAPSSVALELLVESPRVFSDASGRVAIASLVDAAGGRCRSVHLGAYDLLSSLGVLSRHQSLAHPHCVRARQLAVFATAGRGVAVSDGATNELPIAPHRHPSSETERGENLEAMTRAWRRHATDVSRAISEGIFLGWDLHPNQLVSRYVALFSAILGELPATVTRLRRFLDEATKARRSGQDFDDAATAMGLLGDMRRAYALGVADDDTLASAGLVESDLDASDFAAILESRAKRDGNVKATRA